MTLPKNIIPLKVLLIATELKSFTVNQIIDELQRRHQVELSFVKMQNILKDFEQDELLTSEMKQHGARNKFILHYQTTLPDGREQQQRTA